MVDSEQWLNMIQILNYRDCAIPNTLSVNIYAFVVHNLNLQNKKAWKRK